MSAEIPLSPWQMLPSAPKIVGYMILSHINTVTLAKEVSSLLAEGWDLYGQPFTRDSPNVNGLVCQVMIRVE